MKNFKSWSMRALAFVLSFMLAFSTPISTVYTVYANTITQTNESENLLSSDSNASMSEEEVEVDVTDVIEKATAPDASIKNEKPEDTKKEPPKFSMSTGKTETVKATAPNALMTMNMISLTGVEVLNKPVAAYHHMNIGDQIQIKLKLSPEDATEGIYFDTMFTNGVISVDEDGLVTAVANGTGSILLYGDGMSGYWGQIGFNVSDDWVKVTLDANGGTFMDGDTIDVFLRNVGSMNSNELEGDYYVPMKADGSSFNGKWYSEPECYNEVLTPDKWTTFTEDTTLYAGWGDVNEITFDYAGIKYNGKVSSTYRVVSGESLKNNYPSFPDNPRYTEGKILKGWQKADGTILETNSLYSYIPAGSETLTAVWIEDYYTIYFDYGITYNNQTGSEKYIVPGNRLYSVPYLPDYHPEDSSKMLAGWRTSDGTFINNIYSYVPTKSETLTAVWDNYYTVKLDFNGGNYKYGTTKTEYQVAKGASLTSLPTMYSLEKEGYIFSGWIVEETGMKIGNTVSSYTPAGNETLVAQWSEYWTVTIDANGGNYVSSWYESFQVIKGEKVYLYDSGYTNGDYKLAGWCEDKACEGPVFSGYYEPKGDGTLYVKWEKTYKVTLNAGDGWFGNNPNDHTAVKTVIQNHALGNDLISDSWIPKSDDGGFDGWYLDEELTKPVKRSYKVAGDVIFYAKWKDYYVITIPSEQLQGSNLYLYSLGEYVSAAEVKIAVGDPLDNFGSLNRQGYKGTLYLDEGYTLPFDSNYIPTSDMTLYVKWDPRVTVSWDADGGHDAYGRESGLDYIAPGDAVAFLTGEDLRKDGYAFAGWYTADGVKVDRSTRFYEDTAVKARWIEGYKVTFNLDGGSLAEYYAERYMPYKYYNAGDSIGYLPAPLKEGFGFNGWVDQNGKTYEYLQNVVIKGEMTFTAQWISGHQVTLHAGEGEIYDQRIGEYVDTVVVTLPSGKGKAAKSLDNFSGFHKDGKVKAGWSLSEGGERLDLYNYSFTKDTDLYVDWELGHTVIYVLNGGGYSGLYSNKTLSYTYEVGQKVYYPNDMDMEHQEYKFAGWYTNPDFTGDAIHIPDSNYVVTDNIVLYAKWVEDMTGKWTVKFNSQGGSSVESQIVKDGKTAVEPTDPTKEGNTFTGWYKDADCEKAFDFATPIISDITLYAGWEGYPDLYDAVVTVNGTYSYTGENVIPEITVVLDGTKLVKDVDYTVSGGGINTGEATVTITAIEGRELVGSKTVAFTIEKASLENVELPNLSFYMIPYGSTLKDCGLAEGWTWKDGEDTPVGNVGGNYFTVVYNPDPNNYYDYETTATVWVDPAYVGDADFEVEVLGGPFIYTGYQIRPEVSVKLNGQLLSAGDYSVSYFDNVRISKQAGIKISVSGNYSGSTTVYFSIISEPWNLAGAEVSLSSYEETYDGSEFRPTAKVLFNDELLTENVDYTVSYERNVLPGYGAVVITGTGTKGTDTYYGTYKAYFKIYPGGYTLNGYVGQTLSEVELPYGWYWSSSSTVLEYTGLSDYFAFYSADGNIMTNVLMVVRVEEVPVGAQKISQATISVNETCVYNGQAHEPELTVVHNGNTLVKGHDYTAVYSNNIDAGQATVTITGINGYYGTKKGYFYVQSIPITLTVGAGEYIEVMDDAEPFNLNVTPSVDVPCYYYVSDEDIVKVDEDGLVTIVGAGTAYISVETPSIKNHSSGFANITIVVQSTGPKGWVETESGKMYYVNGKPVKADFVEDNGDFYYFNEDGYMVANEWIKFVSEDFTGWRYMKNNGAAMKSDAFKLKKIGSEKYAFDSEGWMHTGWVISSENRMIYSNGEWTKADYYFNKDGAAVSGWKQIKIYNDHGDWYEKFFFYFDPETHQKQHGLIEENGLKYYLDDETGAMLENTEITIDGVDYLIDGDGVLHEMVFQIIKNPEDAYTAVDEPAEFKVEAIFAENYQWFFTTDGKVWNEVTDENGWGYTSDTLYLYAEDVDANYQVYCVVTDENGNTLESAIASLTVTLVPAVTGTWHKEESGLWRCYDEDGDFYEDVFALLDGKYYYLGEDGYMVTSSFVDYEGTLYYVKSDGTLAIREWFEAVPEDADEDSKKYWYYSGSTGKMVRGIKIINEKTYAFDEEGKMLTGWVEVDDSIAHEAEDWRYRNVYYFDEKTGERVTNEWRTLEVYGGWKNPDGYAEHTFHFTSKGNKRVGLKKINNVQYYFDETGARLEDQELKVDCTLYVMDKDGVVTVKDGHTEVIVPGKEATCTEDGLTDGKYCSVCETELVSQEVIEAPGHTVVIDKEVKVTCTTDGLTEGKHCSVCETVLVKQEIIEARGKHDFEHGSCKDCGEDAPIAAPKLKISGEANSGKPKLSWDAVEDAVAYNVERSLKKSSGYELLKEGVEDTVYVDDSAVAGTLYYYRISAVNADGIESKYSNTPSRTCDLATPEITVENIASSGKIKISWNAVEGAAKYEVYRAETEDGTFTRLSTTTKTSLTNSKDMEAGDTYYYKVRAIHDNSNANSAYSEIASETCALAQPKVKVSNVASSGKIQLTWDKVEGAKKYEVYRSVGDNESYERLGSTTSTKYTNTSVTAGEIYYYKVIALHADEEANSAYSAEVSRLCKLGRPTVTVVTEAVTGKPEISWKEITGAVEYEVYRSAEEGDAGTLVGKTYETSYTDADTGIKAGEVYYYTVKAVHENAGANSAVSTAVPVTCALEQPTVTVSNNASNGTLKLSWNKVTGAAKYEVYRAVGEDGTYKLLKTTTSRSLSNTSVTPGETYYYKVIAVHTNTEANSAESAVVSGICKLARPSVTVSNNESTGKIKISWEAVEGAAKYEVYRAETADAADEEYILLKAVTGTSLTNSSVETGKTYYYKVVAVHENEEANSTDSAVVSGICKLARPSVKVSNDLVTGKPQIRWSSVDGAIAYDVYGSTSKNSGYEELGRVETVAFTEEAIVFTDEAAEAGMTYYYKVAAVHADEEANSAFSSVKNRTCDLAQPVIELENDSSTGKIRVRWEKLDGAEEYEIYRADSEDGKYRRLSTVSGTTSSYVDKKAEPGNVYYYKVCANHEKSAADSVDSEVAAAICILARPSVTVSNVSSTGKIKVSWKAVEGAEGYVVLRADSKDGEYEVLKETTGTSLTNTSVETGKTYYYKVIAIHENPDAVSYESTAKSGICKLAAPTVSITTKDGKPRLTWKKVTGAVKYEVYRATSKDGSYSLIKTTTGTSLTNTSATKGKTYYYKVKAIYSNTKANSAYSSVKSIKATK